MVENDIYHEKTIFFYFAFCYLYHHISNKPTLSDKNSFSMILLPDPQSYTKFDTNQPIFELMTAWVASPDEIRHLNKMGDKSEAFCRQAAVVLEDNPKLIPPGFSVADLRQDITDLDLMRPRFLRLRELLEKVDSTEMALGSDIINAALEGYGYMKMGGKSAGLDGLREGDERPLRQPPRQTRQACRLIGLPGPGHSITRDASS